MLPRPGGWENQPLRVLVRLQLMEIAHRAFETANNEGMGELTKPQAEILGWLERG